MVPNVAAARAAVRAGLERTPLARGVELAAEAAELPARLLRALVEVESLLGRVGPLLDRMEDLTERAAGVLAAAGETVGHAAGLNAEAAAAVYDATEVTSAARAVVERAGALTADAARTAQTADALLGHVEPILARAAPLAEKFVSGLSAAQIEAAAKVVDELPRLTDHLRNDILPILATLDRAGPDLTELVGVGHDVRRAIADLPGLGFVFKRADEAVADAAAPEKPAKKAKGKTGKS